MTNRFKDAIDVQNACNPSGVALLFSCMCAEFRLSPEFTGTDSIRNDPALQLVAYKLFDLMHGGIMDTERYGRAYHACQSKAAGETNAHS